MKKVLSDKAGSIMKEKDRLEKVLKVKLTNRGKEIYIEGEPFQEYDAEKVIDAITFGFGHEVALMIKTRELTFDTINIKNYTKRTDLKSIRARIIGRKGKTLATLTQLTDCFFEINNNDIGIIGHPEEIKKAQEAVINIIKGSKQANVYKFLEKHRPEPVIDLGLKQEEKREKAKKKKKDSEE